MKKIYIIIISLITNSAVVFAQIDFGVKAGFNLGTEGALSVIKKGNLNDIHKWGVKNNKGYHVGVFSKIKIPVLGIFAQPELYYSFNKESYKNESLNGDLSLENNRWTLPVLLGWEFLRIANVKLGPVFMYDSHQDIRLVEHTAFKKNNKAEIGMQIGAGVVLKNFHIDLRWQKLLTNSYMSFSDNTNNYQTKSRPSALLISLGYNFL